jgi:hypothetical protein
MTDKFEAAAAAAAAATQGREGRISMTDKFESVKKELQAVGERGYGSHARIKTESWMESDDIYIRIACTDCGSWTEDKWPPSIMGGILLNPKEAVRVMMLRFTENTPSNCMEAWRLNVVRRVMLS